MTKWRVRRLSHRATGWERERERERRSWDAARFHVPPVGDFAISVEARRMIKERERQRREEREGRKDDCHPRAGERGGGGGAVAMS